MRAVFLRHLADPLTESLLALHAGVAVGFITFHIRRRLNRLRPEAWVPNFIVTEHFQGLGVAPVLFRTAMQRARERGCYRLALESNYPLTRAHRLYHKQGMSDAGKYFTLRLDSDHTK